MKIVVKQASFALTAFGFNPEADYETVWEEKTDCPAVMHNGVWHTPPGPFTDDVILERCFARFQRVDPMTGPWPPDGYKGRSLSVGDVVELDDRAYAVAVMGFTPVELSKGAHA